MSLDIFTKNLMNSTNWNTNTLNKHWLILDSVGAGQDPLPSKVRYFILDTLDTDTTQAIKTAISTTPNEVIFNSSGDIQWGSGKIRRNRWATNGELDPTMNLENIKDTVIAAISADSDSNSQIIYYDENSIISPNLKYILYLVKDGTTENYKLLYNPIHRKSFLNYYNSQPDDTFGATSDLALNVFPNYCNSFLMNDGKAYLDPSCNTFIDINTCTASAFAQNNATFKSRKLNEVPAIAKQINEIGTYCVYANGSPTMKYGTSPFVSGKLNDSFILSNIKNQSPFQTKAYGQKPNEINFTTQVCDIAFKSGGDIDASDANISTICNIKPSNDPNPPTPSDPSNPPTPSDPSNPPTPSDPSNPPVNPPSPSDPSNPPVNPPSPSDPSNPPVNPPSPSDPSNPPVNPPSPSDPSNPPVNPPSPSNQPVTPPSKSNNPFSNMSKTSKYIIIGGASVALIAFIILIILIIKKYY